MSEPRVFGYCRASTAKQSASPETQKGLIRKYAEMSELPEPTFFTDPSKSGKVPLDKREAGKALLLTVRPGDHIIIAKLDRMFRSLMDGTRVLEELRRRGVRLHVCNAFGGSLDLSSPIGKWMLHMLIGFAELERDFISERTKDGLAASKNQGKRHTRHAGYGFTWEKRRGADGKPEKVKVSDPEERRVMKSIVVWKMQNDSTWEQIEKHLDSLKIRTREGKPWDQNRIRRAYKAEMLLQAKEQRVSL